MTLALAFLDWGKLAAQAVAGWLSRRSLGEIVAIILALALAVDHLALLASHRHSAKLEEQLKRSAQALADGRANVTMLVNAIAKQNAAIAALSAKSAQQQQIAAKAENLASQRAGEAQAASERLRASARSAAGKTAPRCEPSEALKEQWP